MEAAGVLVFPDDLARGVDAERLIAERARRIIHRRKATAAKDETVDETADLVRSDDLARAVDAGCVAALGTQGIIDRREDIDWHVVALLAAYGSRHRHHRYPEVVGPSAPTWTLAKGSTRVKKLIFGRSRCFSGGQL